MTAVQSDGDEHSSQVPLFTSGQVASHPSFAFPFVSKKFTLQPPESFVQPEGDAVTHVLQDAALAGTPQPASHPSIALAFVSNRFESQTTAVHVSSSKHSVHAPPGTTGHAKSPLMWQTVALHDGLDLEAWVVSMPGAVCSAHLNRLGLPFCAFFVATSYAVQSAAFEQPKAHILVAISTFVTSRKIEEASAIFL